MNSAALQMWIKSVEAQLITKGRIPSELIVYFGRDKCSAHVLPREDGESQFYAPDLPELMEKVNAFVAKYKKPSQTTTLAELKARQGYVDPRAVYGSTGPTAPSVTIPKDVVDAIRATTPPSQFTAALKDYAMKIGRFK